MSSTKLLLAASLALFALPACNDGREPVRYPGTYNVGRAPQADSPPEVAKAPASEGHATSSSRSSAIRTTTSPTR